MSFVKSFYLLILKKYLFLFYLFDCTESLLQHVGSLTRDRTQATYIRNTEI